MGGAALAVGDRRPARSRSASRRSAFDDHDADLLAALTLESFRRSTAPGCTRPRPAAADAEATARRLGLLQSLTARFSSALTAREVARSRSRRRPRRSARRPAPCSCSTTGMFEIHASSGSPRTLGVAEPADLPTPAGDAIHRAGS
jgi:hypothetical protein